VCLFKEGDLFNLGLGSGFSDPGGGFVWCSLSLSLYLVRTMPWMNIMGNNT
jgi:hypothetical protein